MIDTRIGPETAIEETAIDRGRAPAPSAPSAPDRGRRGRRSAMRLWVLLHGPALLDGPAGRADDVALVEDDRGRLAGPRGW